MMELLISGDPIVVRAHQTGITRTHMTACSSPCRHAPHRSAS